MSVDVNDQSSLVELPPDHPNLPTHPPYIYLGAMLVGFSVHWIKPVSSRPDKWGGLGIVFCVFAVGLLAWSWLTLKRHRTDVRPWKPTKKIVTDGPYALTRNPIYLGFALLQVGIGLWSDRLAVLLMVIPAIIATNNWVIAREEAYLARKFGEPYEQYLAQVRRWL